MVAFLATPPPPPISKYKKIVVPGVRGPGSVVRGRGPGVGPGGLEVGAQRTPRLLILSYIMYHYHRGSDHGSSTSGSTWRTHTFLPLGLVLVLIYVNRNEIS